MLQFLKKLLKREPKEITVLFSELEDFLKKKSLPYEGALEKDIKSKVEEIEGFRKSILEDIKKVEHANLQNPNIPYRAKVVMQGNRDAFVRSISRFFSAMNFSFESVARTAQKSREVVQRMDELARSSARSYAILSQFFGKEIEPITASIKKIDDHLKSIITKAEDDESVALHRMILEVQNIGSKVKMREGWLSELTQQAKHLDEKRAAKEQTQEHISKKKESKEYWEYEQMIQTRRSYEKQLQQLENTLFHDFSDLERALKKYSKISLEHEKLIQSYLDNAMHALLADEKLEVMTLLESLKKSADSLDLDEKRKERVLARISALTSDYFLHIQGKYKDNQMMLQSILAEIEQNANRHELMMLEEALQRMDNEITQLSVHMQKINENIASLDIQKMKKGLETKVNEKLKEKITLADSAPQ